MTERVVTTRYGMVRGRESEGVATFLGIPYAGPPTGSARFSPPRPPEPWAGILECDDPGPIAPQPASLLGGYVPGDPDRQEEACLSLNIFAPAEERTNRPVMIYIHGGAFAIGTGGGVMYRGESLARRGVVVVTFNYRLGALGFLAHPALATRPGDPWANWGVLDQLAALEFVRDEIGAFGGDPANVTIFGESAGAMSAADLLAVPAARGLFRRAILESGAVETHSAAGAIAVAERLCRALGLGGVDRKALESVPVAAILDAQGTLFGDLGVGASLPFRPVVDGTLLPDDPERVIADGGGGIDALLIGTNRDEFRFFTIGHRELDDADDEALAPYVAAYLPSEHGARALEIIAAYRSFAEQRGAPLLTRQIFESIAGDAVFWAPATRLASASSRHRPTFVYRFEWTSPFMGGSLGSCHGLELPFVFGTTTNGFVGLFSGTGPDVDTLTDRIQSAWVAFATHGDPAADGSIIWPSYDERSRTTVVLDREPGVIDRPREGERVIWEELLEPFGSPGA